MTNSSKLILKITLFSAVTFMVFGLLTYVFDTSRMGAMMTLFYVLSGGALTITGISFVAFLISLLVSSAKGN
jgi:intracellular septation protein A